MSEGERTDTEAEIRAARLAKVDRLRQRGDDPYPADFPGRVDVVSVRDRFGELEAGAETGEAVRLGGRITGRRGFGKAMFLDLADRSGTIQLHATADGTAGFDELSEELALGDILGVDGQAVADLTGLAKSLYSKQKGDGVQIYLLTVRREQDSSVSFQQWIADLTFR